MGMDVRRSVQDRERRKEDMRNQTSNKGGKVIGQSSEMRERVVIRGKK